MVGAVWVVYEAGGVLRYKEIASLALVRTPRGVAINIVDIWVDSVPAMSGGRELWGIPKEMGVFDTRARETFEAAVKEASGVPIASMTFKTRVRFPFALPFAAKIAQERCGLLTTLDLRVRGNVAIGRSDWEIPADSRLSYLPGRRPLLSLRVGDARIRFGNEAPRAERNGAG